MATQNTHSHIIAPTHLKKFIFGGQATFTVVSNTTGNRLTFEVKYPKKKITNEDGKDVKVIDREKCMFVSVLTGNDNNSNYTYIGHINKNKTSFVYADGLDKRGKKKTIIGQDAPSVQVIGRMIAIIAAGGVPTNATIYHEGRCGICGKRLTVPNSILTGIGPECEKNYNDEGKKVERVAKERKRKITNLFADDKE
jgi:hypothetical protein